MITHFCAPAFVFLSGISAYLAGMRRSKSQLSGFLIKRGLWLIVVEIVVITFAGTIDPFYRLVILQVIWAIGGSMVLLGLLVWAPLWVIGGIGTIIFFGHNILDLVDIGPLGQTIGWKLLLSANGFGHLLPLGQGHRLLIAYALLPWTGVMLIGYMFGSLYQSTVAAARRKKDIAVDCRRPAVAVHRFADREYLRRPGSVVGTTDSRADHHFFF